MTSQGNSNSCPASVNEAIATAIKLTSDSVQGMAATMFPSLHKTVEQGTETVGRIVTPIAENPLVKLATTVPGLKWLMAALGQVNVQEVQKNVAELRQKYPLATEEELAQRIMSDIALKAAGVGVVTNFIPPLALMLLAVDLAAITALQAEMVYHIAAIYGFPPTDSTRRGEVLAIWGLSTGGSGVLKTGLSVVEMIPVIGTFAGATGNAALLYSLGYIACRFYEMKKQNANHAVVTVDEMGTGV